MRAVLLAVLVVAALPARAAADDAPDGKRRVAVLE